MSTLVTTIVTSAAVSSFVTFILKAYFKRRIEHYYQIELEKYKSELAAKLTEEQGLTARRIQGYPIIVELVYRTRNMARDLVKAFSPSVISLGEEFGIRTQELEDNLYRFRSDLERDGLFTHVHKYKNSIKNFNMKLSDIKYFLEHNEEHRANHARNELDELYQVIEDLHKNVINELSLPEESSNR